MEKRLLSSSAKRRARVKIENETDQSLSERDESGQAKKKLKSDFVSLPLAYFNLATIPI